MCLWGKCWCGALSTPESILSGNASGKWCLSFLTNNLLVSLMASAAIWILIRMRSDASLFMENMLHEFWPQFIASHSLPSESRNRAIRVWVWVSRSICVVANANHLGIRYPKPFSSATIHKLLCLRTSCSKSSMTKTSSGVQPNPSEILSVQMRSWRKRIMHQ